jgi:hypothetical protein
MPFAGLLKAIMASKFEWQFKYRDEGYVNAAARRRPKNARSPQLTGTSAIRQIRFTVPIFGQR